MRKFALVSAADQAAALAAERAAVEQISTNVARRRRNGGFGVILLKTDSPNLCGVVTDKVEAHKLLILKNADKLTFDMRLAPALAVELAENAFVGAQKAQLRRNLCLGRRPQDDQRGPDPRSHSLCPFGFLDLHLRLDAKDAEVVEKHRLEEQQAAERAQKEADEARLADQRAKDQARLGCPAGTLRTRYDGSAKAAVAAIVADVTGWGQDQVDRPGSSFRSTPLGSLK